MSAKGTRGRSGDAPKGAPATRRMRGFEPAAGLLQTRIRKAGETRGFAIARLLTHWPEIVGEATAAVTRPVRVSYRQSGFGATLTLLTTGANAPMIQADLPRIKDKVNACYGYAAISHIRLTQTAPEGFAEGRAQFDHARPKAAEVPAAPPEPGPEAQSYARKVRDPDLRAAIERLAQNVLSRNRKS